MADTKPPFAGKSILERMWKELDDIMEALMEKGPPDVDPVKQPAKAAAAIQEYGELRGQAQGVAYCIAMVQNPYEVDLPGVKKEALRRWEAAGD